MITAVEEPSFKVAPSSFIASDLQSPRVLVCTASGKPLPNVVWSLNGKILQETSSKGKCENFIQFNLAKK